MLEFDASSTHLSRSDLFHNIPGQQVSGSLKQPFIEKHHALLISLSTLNYTIATLPNYVLWFQPKSASYLTSTKMHHLRLITMQVHAMLFRGKNHYFSTSSEHSPFATISYGGGPVAGGRNRGHRRSRRSPSGGFKSRWITGSGKPCK